MLISETMAASISSLFDKPAVKTAIGVQRIRDPLLYEPSFATYAAFAHMF